MQCQLQCVELDIVMSTYRHAFLVGIIPGLPFELKASLHQQIVRLRTPLSAHICIALQSFVVRLLLNAVAESVYTNRSDLLVKESTLA